MYTSENIHNLEKFVKACNALNLQKTNRELYQALVLRKNPELLGEKFLTGNEEMIIGDYISLYESDISFSEWREVWNGRLVEVLASI
ncbi:MAG: hypothetical protein PHU61_00920 [Candidatus Absconditabacteria bacterium]|nr:hypothetical protein [Candidatus Absconditabacteria bacterium]MDD3868433.1 hypothetical protein [Candidatus Absconditabacteria bacterium]MDD4714043.1 hypothetical protein [Candidatus Absconditabacteria bacterium]